MDSPGIIDEVIADSEGELDEEEHPGNGGILSVNLKDVANTVSQVSAFTLPGQLQRNITSSISAFTGPSAFWKQTSDTGGQLNQLSDIDNFLDTTNIADRAKTRQRNPKSSIQSSFAKPKPNAMASSDGQLERQKSNGNVSSDIIELTSDEDDDELSLRPSKLKPRPRPEPRLKVKDKPGDTSSDKTPNVFGTTEGNTDNSPHAIPDSRPRPRPRPLVRRNKIAQEGTVPPPLLPLGIPDLLPSSSESASHGPELPIATSPIQLRPNISQLLPSDPPLPTLTTIHDENVLPQIETLPNLDFDGPLSSPSSLFGDLSGPTKKRKRTNFDLDIDELASDIDLDSGKRGTGATLSDYDNGVAAQVPPHLLPPPPTFFGGSSSSSIGGGDRRIPHVPARDIVDLTMLPPTIQPTSVATAKKVAKAKTSRRKKGNKIGMNEDELDDDFDPIESTKKAKSKPKSKKPKTKAKKANPPAATKAKSGNVAWSDDDVEDSAIEVDVDPSAGLSKGQKPVSRMEDDTDEERSTKKQKAKGGRSKTRSKKPVEDVDKHDDDASIEDHEDIQDQQLTPEAEVVKTNIAPPMKSTAKTSKTDDKPNVENPGLFPSLHSRYEIAPRRSSLPMSELIRRANSIPGSPFATPHPRTSSSSARPVNSGTAVTYSPYLKSSRSLLSRIAPLHPNRRTPPPLPPPPPPRKKTKKELEMEEKWEEEMIDSVGGVSEWTCLADDEKKELRRAKWAREMGGWDD